MAAPGRSATVALRPKAKRPRSDEDGTATMSRRRISCKELGNPDHQGWLYKKREIKSFIGNKWKRFWFVLTGTSLYWYSNQIAEKAEGFISLPEFKVDRALECKKKYAIKACDPQTKIFYFAADNAEEMHKWLAKLGLAAFQNVPLDKDKGDGWSESEHEDSETVTDGRVPTADMDNLLTPSSSTSTLPSKDSFSSLECMHSESLSAITVEPTCQEQQTLADTSSISANSAEDSLTVSLKMDRRVLADRTQSQQTCLANESEEFLTAETYSSQRSENHLVIPVECPVLSRTLDSETHKGSEDEMEKLYKSLEEASLSPLGSRRRPSSKKELRKSFVKRCKNPAVNEQLHRARMLNSTLKAKEADLNMIDQLLEDSNLTAQKFREWKSRNSLLFQDIYKQYFSQLSTDQNEVDSQTVTS